MNLPQLLPEILKSLTFKEQVKYSTVCRSWRTSMPYNYYRSLDFHEFWKMVFRYENAGDDISIFNDQKLLDEASEFVVRHAGPKLRRVDALDCEFIPKKIIHLLAAHCPNLVQLRIQSMPFKYLTRFPRLESLTLEHFLLTKPELQIVDSFLQLEQLNYLEVRRLDYIGQIGSKPRRLARKCRSEDSPEYNRGLQREARNRAALVASFMVSLKTSALQVCSVEDSGDYEMTNQALEILCGNCPGIKDITLNTSNVSCLLPLAHLRRLVSLSVSNGEITDQSGFTDISLNHGETLKKLSISWPDSLLDFRFLQNLSVLETLELTGCTDFTTDDLRRLDPNAPLRSFQLYGTGAASDDGVAILVNRKYPVNRLLLDYQDCVDGTDDITFTGMTLALQELPLTDLGITGLSEPEEGLLSLVLTLGQRLETLQLDSSVVSHVALLDFLRRRVEAVLDDSSLPILELTVDADLSCDEDESAIPEELLTLARVLLHDDDDEDDDDDDDSSSD